MIVHQLTAHLRKRTYRSFHFAKVAAMSTSSYINIALSLLNFLEHGLQLLTQMLNLTLQLLDMLVRIVSKSGKDLMGEFMLLLETVGC